MTNEGDYNYDGYYDGNVVGNAWHRNDTNVHLYAYANHTLEEADLLKDQELTCILSVCSRRWQICRKKERILQNFSK